MPKFEMPMKAAWSRLKGKENESLYVVLKEINPAGKSLLKKLFNKKAEWEKRNNREYILSVRFDLRYQDKTKKQTDTTWKLIELIWYSDNEDPPTIDEKDGLYKDLLQAYGVKTTNSITGEPRPKSLSEMNSIEAAKFIQELMWHITNMCDLKLDAQSTVYEVIQEWEISRGEMEVDPMDYSDIECTRLLTESEWREKHKFSEASGQGGVIHLHHIVTRGSNKAAENKAWNWLSLTNEEHRILHDKGYDNFLRTYPHLKGRVARAKKLASGLIHGEGL